MTHVREPGAQKVVEFTVPYKGTWKGIAANMLAPDALYDSLNVFIRKGKLRTRPGLTRLENFVFNAEVIGGDLAVGQNSSHVMLAFTTTNAYKKTGTAQWILTNTNVFTLTNTDVIDMTFIETTSQYVGLIANSSFALKQWTESGTVANITPAEGSGPIPLAKSVCTAARRVIALVAPHTVQWSKTLQHDYWPSLGTAGKVISQNNDIGVCVMPLGTLDFVIYKERSLYVARAQPGDDSNAFNIKYVQRCEGPAGVRAVVDTGDGLIHMTATGRIGLFDGATRVRWIADGLWQFLQGDIDPAHAHRIFGVYDYRLHTVTFFYPRTADSGLIKGIVTINLPLEGSGIDYYACFIGTTPLTATHGYSFRLTNEADKSVVFCKSGNDNLSFYQSETTNTDDTSSFSCLFQTSLQPMPDLTHQMVSVESFFERNILGPSGAPQTGQFVDIELATSDILENETGTIKSGNAQRIDLNNGDQKREYVGFNVAGRFAGLKYSWTSTTTARYAGAIMYGRYLA